MVRLPKLKYSDHVEVEWADSVQRRGWEPRTEVEAWTKTSASASHWSCGYYLRHDSRTIVIVQSRVKYDDQSEEMVSESQAIPRMAVRSIRRLR